MPADILIGNLKGGMDDSDLPAGLADDQCALVENVELFYSTLGERRLGCMPIDLTASGLTIATIGVHLTEYLPTNDITEPEYWAIAATVDDLAVMARYFSGAWSPVVPADPIVPSSPEIYQIQSQSLNNKLFFTYLNDVGRVHLWDGAKFRRAGLAEPPDPPTAIDEGVGTYPATVRYFRYRYIEQQGTVIVRRSEPSESVTFTPSGSGDGATITRGSIIGEGETHWELEASTDDAFYFRVQTIPVATTTATDTTDLTTQVYADEGPVSEPIGEYLLLPSAKFIAADADRLLLGSHWTDPALQSRVMWTPVYADPGAGNDERLPLATGGDNYVDLDNAEGGGLTNISQMTNGTWYAFKWSQIYKLSRTGDLTHAYDPICISKARGAMPNSVTSGVDEAGRSCLYFLDPSIGPCSIGAAGLRDHQGLKNTWTRVNVSAADIPCHVVFYPDKQQVHWWLSVDGVDTPNFKIVLQVGQIQQTVSGSATRGWGLATGVQATATASAIWHETTNENGVDRLRARPFVWLLARDEDHNLPSIQRCDVLDTDDDAEYCALLLTRPYLQTGLLNNWGVMAVALLATPSATAELVIALVRDFGVETRAWANDLVPDGAQTFVMRRIDNSSMSEAAAIQFLIGDACSVNGITSTKTDTPDRLECYSPSELYIEADVTTLAGDPVTTGTATISVFDDDGHIVGMPVTGLVVDGVCLVGYPGLPIY